MTKRHFVTFFSKEYAIYGLTLIDSILSLHKDSLMMAMPLDQESNEILKRKSTGSSRLRILDSVETVRKIEEYREEGRSKAEAIFTVKPLIMEIAIKNIDWGDFIFYCDADLYFFKQMPSSIGIKNRVVVLSEHLFRTSLSSYLQYGKFNAGFVGIRHNHDGLSVLEWWKNKCIESCSKEVKADSFADQKYLEQIASFESRIEVISSKAINQSLWMIDRKSRISKGPQIDGEEIICFHFHGLKAFTTAVAPDFLRYGKLHQSRKVLNEIYRPYVDQLLKNKDITQSFLDRDERSFRDFMKRKQRIYWEK